mgnify:CR=1 FL=1|jgi:hypothetical protein|nr:MAG TPA: hypothetical protein [Caudoviricetes sp.]
MRAFLSMVDGILLILFFIVAFSFALALVLWLVGILGVSILSVAKTFLIMVVNLVVIFLFEELMEKLNI